MEEKKYSIEVYEDQIDVNGKMTCTEAIQILNFCKDIGYNLVEDQYESNTFSCRVPDPRKAELSYFEKMRQREFDLKVEELNKREELYSVVAKHNADLEKRLENLDRVLRNVIDSAKEQQEQMTAEIKKQKTRVKFLELQQHPDVQKILKECDERTSCANEESILNIRNLKEGHGELPYGPEDRVFHIPMRFPQLFNGLSLPIDPALFDQTQAEINKRYKDHLESLKNKENETNDDTTQSPVTGENSQGPCTCPCAD